MRGTEIEFFGGPIDGRKMVIHPVEQEIQLPAFAGFDSSGRLKFSMVVYRIEGCRAEFEGYLEKQA